MEYDIIINQINAILNCGAFKGSNYTKSQIAFIKIDDSDEFKHFFTYPVDINADFAKIFFDIFSDTDEILRKSGKIFDIKPEKSMINLKGFSRAIVFYLFDFLLAKIKAGINDSKSEPLKTEEWTLFIERYNLFCERTNYYCSIFTKLDELRKLKTINTSEHRLFKVLLEALKTFDEIKEVITIPYYSIYTPKVFEAYTFHVIKDKYKDSSKGIEVIYQDNWQNSDCYPDILIRCKGKGTIIIDAKYKYQLSVLGIRFNNDPEKCTIENDLLRVVKYLRTPDENTNNKDDVAKESREFVITYPILCQNDIIKTSLPSLTELPDFRELYDNDKRIRFLVPIQYPESSRKWRVSLINNSLVYDGLTIGTKVRHKMFGEGIITTIIVNKNTKKIQSIIVSFDSYEKEKTLNYAIVIRNNLLEIDPR